MSLKILCCFHLYAEIHSNFLCDDNLITVTKWKERLSIFKILIITNDISSYQLDYLYKKSLMLNEKFN